MIRPRGYSPRGGGCCHGRLQSIPIVDGHPELRHGDRGSTTGAGMASPSTPMTEVMVTSGGTKRADQRDPRRGRSPATRWVVFHRCMIPTLRSFARPGHTAPGAARTRRMALTEEALRTFSTTTPRRSLQQSAQSSRGGRIRAKISNCWRPVLVRSSIRLRSATRSGTCDLRRPRTYFR